MKLRLQTNQIGHLTEIVAFPVTVTQQRVAYTVVIRGTIFGYEIEICRIDSIFLAASSTILVECGVQISTW